MRQAPEGAEARALAEDLRGSLQEVFATAAQVTAPLHRIAPTTYVYERKQLLRIRAVSQDLADREASRDDAPWDAGEISLIDKVSNE